MIVVSLYLQFGPHAVSLKYKARLHLYMYYEMKNLLYFLVQTHWIIRCISASIYNIIIVCLCGCCVVVAAFFFLL